MFSQLLRYLFFYRSFRQSRALGFPQIGFGIEQRKKQMQRFWMPHLERSIEEQTKWLASFSENFESDSSKNLLLLGAGRLYDVPTSPFSRFFSSILLVDADPFCIPYWKNFRKQCPPSCRLDWQILEVSGLIHQWMETLSAASQKTSWEETLRLIRNLADTGGKDSPSSFLSLGSFKSVVSLNILSQIPIIWQDALEQYLNKRFTPSKVKTLEKEWLEAIAPSARFLVLQHLRDLASSGAQNILVLSDLDYVHYCGLPSFKNTKSIEMPFLWEASSTRDQSDGTWRANPSLGNCGLHSTCEITPALYGVELGKPEQRSQLFPDYTSDDSASWLWHIQPSGFEEKEKGTIHRVGAFSFSKKSTIAQ